MSELDLFVTQTVILFSGLALALLSYTFWPERRPAARHRPGPGHLTRDEQKHAAGVHDLFDPPTVPISTGRAPADTWWWALPAADDECAPLFRVTSECRLVVMAR